MTEPIGSPPIATDPLSYAPLYVVRDAGGYDILERVATLPDFEAIPVAELSYFEPRDNGAGDLLNAVLVGDVLRITSAPPQWLQTQAPYTNNDFIVSQVAKRVEGSGAKSFIGGQLQLPGYTFTQADVGRWVSLSDFTDSGNNGKFRITGYQGSTARVNTAFTNDTGGSWAFEWLKVQEAFGGLEPRYFPTQATGLAWELYRAGSPLMDGANGKTSRGNTGPLSRSRRYTYLAPSQDAAEKLFLVTRQQVAALQRAGTLNNTEFTVLITYTVGP